MKVIGALVGLIAAILYAAAAAQILRSETGVDFLGPIEARLPLEVVTWMARAPFDAPENAPSWRLIVMSIAVAAGLFGSVLLVGGSRLSATLLWLSFLLLAGVLVGQDVVLAQGVSAALSQAARPDLIAMGGALALALVFAGAAHAATAPEPEFDDGPDLGLQERAQHVKELLRTQRAAPAPPPVALPPEPIPAPAPPREEKFEPIHRSGPRPQPAASTPPAPAPATAGPATPAAAPKPEQAASAPPAPVQPAVANAAPRETPRPPTPPREPSTAPQPDPIGGQPGPAGEPASAAAVVKDTVVKDDEKV